MDKGLKFEIISGGDEGKTGIKIGGKNYNERKGLYRYFVGMLIGPFLEKFGCNPDDNCWNETYLEFQNLILNSENYYEVSQKYLDENGYEFIGKKHLNFKIRMENGKDILVVTHENKDEFDIKMLLENAKKKELSFGFLPGSGNSIVIVFAKHKRINLTLSSSIQMQDDVKLILEDATNPGSILHSIRI